MLSHALIVAGNGDNPGGAMEGYQGVPGGGNLRGASWCSSIALSPSAFIGERLSGNLCSGMF